MSLFLRLLLAVFSLLGIMDAGYLSYEKLSGVVPPCSPGFACETVLTSPWASVGPIPLSIFGLGFYITMLVITSLSVLEVRSIRIAGITFSVRSLLSGLTAFGFLFSLYLVVVMGVIIKGWCLYCLLSAFISSSLFAISRILFLIEKQSGRQAYPLRLSLMALVYKTIFKPLAFMVDPEFVHESMVRVGRLLGQFWFTRLLTRSLFSYHHASLARTVAGISFPNPIGLSAGFDYDANLPGILPDVGFGFATVGTVTLEPYGGNTRPMLTRLPDSQALLVNKGFKSAGAHAIIAKLTGQTFRIPIGISIGSTNKQYDSLDDQIENIMQCFSLFERSSVAHSYYELNISCPNTKGGQPFTDTKRFAQLLKAFDALDVQKPTFVKMPIDIPKEEFMALLALADKSTVAGVIIGNLTKDHENPLVAPTDRDFWRTRPGGVSGKPTSQRSLERIKWTKKAYGKRFIIIGTGGIASPKDMQQKFEAGADLVQLITGMIYQGPQLLGELCWYQADRSK